MQARVDKQRFGPWALDHGRLVRHRQRVRAPDSGVRNSMLFSLRGGRPLL